MRAAPEVGGLLAGVIGGSVTQKEKVEPARRSAGGAEEAWADVRDEGVEISAFSREGFDGGEDDGDEYIIINQFEVQGIFTKQFESQGMKVINDRNRAVTHAGHKRIGNYIASTFGGQIESQRRNVLSNKLDLGVLELLSHNARLRSGADALAHSERYYKSKASVDPSRRVGSKGEPLDLYQSSAYNGPSTECLLGAVVARAALRPRPVGLDRPPNSHRYRNSDPRPIAHAR